LRLLNGLESPDAGRILLDGVDVSLGDVLDLRRRVGMVFQAPALFPGRVSDNVCYSLALQGIPRDEQDCRGRASLGRVGLSDGFWDRSPTELSQGEQQRVSIARALVCEPDVLLMDEPTSALDPTSCSRILSVVRALNRELGMTVVFVTHLMQQARDVCDRALVLIDGRSIEDGEVPALFETPESELTRRFIDGELVARPREPDGPPAECPPSGGDAT
jgi:ABC-type methionine transport system ATPase subunit